MALSLCYIGLLCFSLAAASTEFLPPVSSKSVSIEVDMDGAWYQTITIASCTAASLGYSVNDTVRITTPPNTYITDTWGSFKLAKCSTTYSTDQAETSCTLTVIQTNFSNLIFGLNARNNNGSRSQGTITVHANEPPAYGSLELVATTK